MKCDPKRLRKAEVFHLYKTLRHSKDQTGQPNWSLSSL